MTVANRKFFEVIEPAPITPGRRAHLAVELLRASIVLDREFQGDNSGWRVRVERIGRHRAMVAEDLGLPYEDEPESEGLS